MGLITMWVMVKDISGQIATFSIKQNLNLSQEKCTTKLHFKCRMGVYGETCSAINCSFSIFLKGPDNLNTWSEAEHVHV